jgi:hypothetical protein
LPLQLLKADAEYSNEVIARNKFFEEFWLNRPSG